MINSKLYETWDKIVQLISEETSSGEILFYKPFVKCEFGMTYISINKSLTKFLIIELNQNAADKFNPPSIKGLSFEICHISKIDSSKVFLKIGASKEMDMEDAFESFAVSLVNELKDVLSYINVLEVIYEVVEKFSQFFGENSKRKLSANEEQGIFGELTFLKSLIDAKGEKYIKCWTGTQKNKHDFIFPNNEGIEIKTLLSQTQKNITISNENQLNFEERSKLFLKVYTLEINPVGITIIDLAQSIDERLYSLETKKIFRQKLLEDGISLLNTESNLKFVVIEENSYLINDQFPRIAKSQISERIFKVKYKLNIDGLEQYKGDILDEQFE